MGDQPTTADIRAAWQKFSAWKRVPTCGSEASGSEFDSWLRAHDARVRIAGHEPLSTEEDMK